MLFLRKSRVLILPFIMKIKVITNDGLAYCKDNAPSMMIDLI